MPKQQTTDFHMKLQTLLSIQSPLTSPTSCSMGNLIIRWHVDVTTLIWFTKGLPNIALYAEGQLTIRKPTSLVICRAPRPAITGKVINPIGNSLSPMKLTSGPLTNHSLSSKIPICWKANRCRMFAELPLSISTLHILYPAIMMVMMRASSCGCYSCEESSSIKVIG